MKKKFKSENIKYEDDFEYIPINEMENNQKQKDNIKMNHIWKNFKLVIK